MIIGDRPEDVSGRHSSPAGHPPGKPAPVPAVHTRPPGPVHPHRWHAPEPSGHDHISVHHDVLRDVGAAMLGRDIDDLEAAVRQLRQASQEFGSLPNWSTGMSFTGNVTAARDGFVTASGQVSDAHASAARKLQLAAESYDEAEHKNRHAAERGGSGHLRG